MRLFPLEQPERLAARVTDHVERAAVSVAR